MKQCSQPADEEINDASKLLFFSHSSPIGGIY
jgi:hypothetical protein